MQSRHDKKNVWRVYRYFFRLGAIQFGGPVALAEAMKRDLVEKEKIISVEEYKEGLALAQLAPGPLATQVAMYIGYIINGFTGATMVSFAFLLAPFLIVLLLSWLYVAYGGLPWLQPVFYGIGAAVVGIITKASYKLLKTTLHHAVLWGIALVLAFSTVIMKEENVWLFLMAGILTTVLVIFQKKHKAIEEPVKEEIIQKKGAKKKKRIFPKRAWFAFLSAGSLASSGLMLKMFFYFFQASLFVFGSGLAIVPFLYGGVVTNYHWLTERQFLDAVAVAMITPGPAVITVAFIGYIIAGIKGAAIAMLGMFLPVYLITVGVAPWFSKISKNEYIKAFIDGVTAAALGALAGAVIIIGGKSIVDVTTFLIAAITLVLLLRTKLPEPIIIVAAGLAGFLLSML